ncbi:hypothetical protein DPMN_029182 [Dreissena polymorpha]|uniref:Uncharacterized protein n=1 Tax=Dreissena polymorpha TaxID=45954 RepID=A0A9D4RG05_DREPO|nr:hypothetical protein DPMN_029182 [Dreissena polymorpha]
MDNEVHGSDASIYEDGNDSESNMGDEEYGSIINTDDEGSGLSTNIEDEVSFPHLNTYAEAGGFDIIEEIQEEDPNSKYCDERVDLDAVTENKEVSQDSTIYDEGVGIGTQEEDDEKRDNQEGDYCTTDDALEEGDSYSNAEEEGESNQPNNTSIPHLHYLAIRRIIHYTIRLSPLMQYTLQRVSYQFADIVREYGYPQMYVRQSQVLTFSSDRPRTLSVARLSRSFDRNSGLMLIVRNLLSESGGHWYRAWLTLDRVGLGWFEVIDVRWR